MGICILVISPQPSKNLFSESGVVLKERFPTHIEFWRFGSLEEASSAVFLTDLVFLSLEFVLDEAGADVPGIDVGAEGSVSASETFEVSAVSEASAGGASSGVSPISCRARTF